MCSVINASVEGVEELYMDGETKTAADKAASAIIIVENNKVFKVFHINFVRSRVSGAMGNVNLIRRHN